MPGLIQEKSIRTVCKECGTMCPMIVRVEEGRATRIDPVPGFPAPRDKLCWKAAAGLERLTHPDRLTQPLKRLGRRGEGQWQPISWKEALKTIGDRLKAVKAQSGAEAVAFVKGYYDRRCDFVSRLANVFGTPNIAGIDNTCYIPSASGRLMTYGFDGRPDFSGGPECILSWGAGGCPPVRPGGKLIVVNALRTKSTQHADLWLQPRPATDLALALGILHVIVQETLYDAPFVAQWTTGFDQLKSHIQPYTPEKVAVITWVPAEKIQAAARMFAAHRYACLQIGNAGEDTFNSTQFARATAIIQAICGTLDIPGGTIEALGTPFDFEGTGTDVLRRLLSPTQVEKKLGAQHGHFPPDDLWELIANKPAELQSQYLVSTLLDKKPYAIQAAFVLGANPVMTWSNARRVHQAFSQIEFLAVADLIMTPTAALADIVLPAASYLETDAVVVTHLGHGDACIQAQQKTVQIGECRTDLEIILGLAGQLGLSHHFWPDPHAYLDSYLQRVGMTFDELRQRDLVVCSGVHYRKYLQQGFKTPSGKVELYSSLCEKWGYAPLPDYHEPRETPLSAPELLPVYPLVLTSCHEKNYIHSQGRHLNTIRSKTPEPLVLIHPQTAAGLGIAQGDLVTIESRRGAIRQKAALSEDLDPRVVSVAYGWWFPEKGASAHYGWDEANINVLTDDSPPYSPEIGSPSMRGFLCRVYKA